MTDAEQFETFMREYQNMVFSTAMRLVANRAEAEDISQEVFLKAYERFAELRDSPTVAGWLKTVTTNMSLNHLSRYRARWSFFSIALRARRLRGMPVTVGRRWGPARKGRRRSCGLARLGEPVA